MDNLSEVGKQALDMLKELAKGIGVGVKEIYPFAVKECIVEGIIAIARVVASGIISIITILNLVSIHSKIISWEIFTTQILCFVLILIVGLVSTCCFLGSITALFSDYDKFIGKLVNPQYHAVGKVIKLANRLKK